MTRFDIIIPTIGRESLKTAVESVINQTHTDWRLMIVGDGLGECPKSIIIDPRISFLALKKRHNDSGATPRNHGIGLTSSEWLCFLDDDDEYLPHHLSFLHSNILTNPSYDMFCTVGRWFKWKRKHRLSKQKIKKLGHVNEIDVMTPGICCKRELFKRTVGWTADLNRHDQILWNDMIEAGGHPLKLYMETFLYDRTN